MQLMKILSEYAFIAVFKASRSGWVNFEEPGTDVQKPIIPSYPPLDNITSVNVGTKDKSLKNWAVTSTGFIGDAKGTIFFKFCWASLGIGFTFKPSS